MVKRQRNTIYRCLILCLLAMVLTEGALALDNPDAPDLVSDFKERELTYLTAIENPGNGMREFLIAYNNYLLFLNKELKKASEIMTSKLSGKRNSEFMASQLQWVKYRDAEFELINNIWTRKDFGSSAGMSRGDYKTNVVRDRVIQLLHYAKNF